MGYENIAPPNVVYLDDLNSANPDGTVDLVNSLDQHIRGVKNALLLSFPQITGPVNATQAQLNYLVIAALGTAEASKALTMNGSGVADIANLVIDNPAFQSYREIISALGNVATTQALNFADANYFTATMTANTTFSFTNPVASRRCTITLELNTGGFTPTWPGTVAWSAGVTPPSSSGKDVYTFTTVDNGTTWLGWQIGYNMS